MLGFFGGMKYQERKAPQMFRQFSGPNGARDAGQRRLNQGFRPVNGEILSKDEQSITIKLQDGGSKIVFISDSTSVMKSTQGSLGDIAVGGQVMATGSPNPDGSISAQSIQIRSIVQPAAPLSSADQSANIK